MVSFVCGWQIWKTKTMFTNKKYHHSNFGHIHFCKPYTRNFKIFLDLGPAGSIITGRGSCMGLSVLVAEIWARNWWSKKPGLCLPAMSCQVLSIIIIIREWGTPLNLLWGCAAESMALSTCSRKKGIIRSSVPENNIIAKIGMSYSCTGSVIKWQEDIPLYLAYSWEDPDRLGFDLHLIVQN